METEVNSNPSLTESYARYLRPFRLLSVNIIFIIIQHPAKPIIEIIKLYKISVPKYYIIREVGTFTFIS